MAKIYTKGTTVVDEVLSGAERYDIKDNGGTPIESNVQINLATSVAVAGTTINAARLNNIETGIDTLDTKVADANDLLTTGGTTTAYTLTTTGAAALATGERFRVKFNATAGATPTLNRDSKGAKSLKYYDSAGAKTACTASNIVANLITDIVYDGTDYVVLDPAGVSGSGGGSTSLPEGTLINGRLLPSVTSNNLTLAIKTFAGTNPSVSDVTQVVIGGVLRNITSALSVTKNAGTNWCNSGSAELATQEVDYFAYIGYNATDGVVLGFSRIPYGTIYSDFSTTSTNEKYCAISTITNAASGDAYVNIGRFAATLSAGAGYTWTVPTFTPKNLIQYPKFNTRVLSYAPTVTWTNGPTSATNIANYKVIDDQFFIKFRRTGTQNGSNSTNFLFTIPWTPKVGGGAWRTAFGSGSVSDMATFTQIAECHIDDATLGIQPQWTASRPTIASIDGFAWIT